MEAWAVFKWLAIMYFVLAFKNRLTQTEATLGFIFQSKVWKVKHILSSQATGKNLAYIIKGWKYVTET